MRTRMCGCVEYDVYTNTMNYQYFFKMALMGFKMAEISVLRLVKYSKILLLYKQEAGGKTTGKDK